MSDSRYCYKFSEEMTKFCGLTAKIVSVNVDDDNETYYILNIDPHCFRWQDYMFEGILDEESLLEKFSLVKFGDLYIIVEIKIKKKL